MRILRNRYTVFFPGFLPSKAATQGAARVSTSVDNMTGGFAFLACPAEYRVTGVMSFLVNQNGVILQKDLGPETAESAKAMTAFDLDSSQASVE